MKIDGELYNHELKDDFNTITSIVRKATPNQEELDRSRELIQYHVYDMPSHSGLFDDRSFGIICLLSFDHGRASSPLFMVDTALAYSQATLDRFYAVWIEAGYEGQMVRLNGSYENKRSNNLMKRKDFMSQEFPVIRIEEGKGNWSRLSARTYTSQTKTTLNTGINLI